MRVSPRGARAPKNARIENKNLNHISAKKNLQQNIEIFQDRKYDLRKKWGAAQKSIFQNGQGIGGRLDHFFIPGQSGNLIIH